MSTSSRESDLGSISDDDSEFNYIPGYYEPIETENQASDGEFSDDHEALDGAYANEPLADEDWLREYNKQKAEKQQRLESLKDRLAGKESLILLFSIVLSLYLVLNSTI